MIGFNTLLRAEQINPVEVNGNRTYIITARRITSGELLKYRNGFLIRGRYEKRFRRSRSFALTNPASPCQR